METRAETERRIEEVDTVVATMGSRANSELFYHLEGKVKEVYSIGDCAAPQGMFYAILDRERIGKETPGITFPVIG